MTVTSESIPKRELHLACISGTGDLAEAGAAERGVGVAKVNCVEGVECLDAQIERFAFSHGKSFHETQVQIEGSRSDRNVPLCVARRVQRLNLERVDVQEVQTVLLRIDSSVRIADSVWSQRTSVTAEE